MKKYENGYLVEPEELEALEKGENIKLEGESHAIDTGMTLYEMNQQLVNQMPVLSKSAAHTKVYEKWRQWITDHQAHFYAFICRDGGEYTFFVNRTGNAKPGKFWDEIWEVFDRIGETLSIEPSPEGMEDVVEVWIRAREEEAKPLAYYLVDWDEGTIEL
jgi:hypothetical protein